MATAQGSSNHLRWLHEGHGYERKQAMISLYSFQPMQLGSPCSEDEIPTARTKIFRTTQWYAIQSATVEVCTDLYKTVSCPSSPISICMLDLYELREQVRCKGKFGVAYHHRPDGCLQNRTSASHFVCPLELAQLSMFHSTALSGRRQLWINDGRK